MQNTWWASIETEKNLNVSKIIKKDRRGTLAIVFSFALIVALMLVCLIFSPDPYAPKPGDFNSTVYATSTEGVVSECGDTFVFNINHNNFGYLSKDFFEDPVKNIPVARNIPNQPSIVPVYGYFYDVYPEVTHKLYSLDNPADVKALDKLADSKYLDHLLYDGLKVVWYDSTVDPTTISSIKTFVATHPSVIALPWVYDAKMPMNRRFAFSAWGITQSCGLWNTDMAAKFDQFSEEHKITRPKDPQKAPVDANGDLYRIDPNKK
jgi:hypothetical protein